MAIFFLNLINFNQSILIKNYFAWLPVCECWGPWWRTQWVVSLPRKWSLHPGRSRSVTADLQTITIYSQLYFLLYIQTNIIGVCYCVINRFRIPKFFFYFQNTIYNHFKYVNLSLKNCEPINYHEHQYNMNLPTSLETLAKKCLRQCFCMKIFVNVVYPYVEGKAILNNASDYVSQIYQYYNY